MSSNLFYSPLDKGDLDTIKDVMRHSGFRYEEPMCGLDRDAARHVFKLYQQGNHNGPALIEALCRWADHVAADRVRHRQNEV